MKASPLFSVLIVFLATIFISIILIAVLNQWLDGIGIETVGLAIDISSISVLIFIYYLHFLNLSRLKILPDIRELSILTVLGLLIYLLEPLINIPLLVKGLKQTQISTYSFSEHIENYKGRIDFLSIYSIFRAIIIVPIYEELIFRRFFIDKLRKKYKPIFVIFFTSFLFSLWHLDLEQSIYAFIMGCLFGGLYYSGYKLWSIIYLHSLINLIFTIFSTKYTTFNYYNIAVLFVILIISIIWLIKIIFNKKHSI